MLSLLPEFQTATILRTRNPDYLAQCDIVVDVGAIFDSSTHRYDHHQRDFTGTFSDAHKIKLSSAGLVYKHFGKRIIHSVLSGICSDVFGDELVGICYLKIYESFIQHIDGIDNGVEVSDGELNYDISTTLSARVGRLNPAWNEDQSASVTNSQFSKAMILTGSEFVDHVTDLVQRWWPARAGVIKGINSRLHVHPSGSLVVFDNACPWQSHLFDVEKEMQISPILYVIFPDSGGSWRIQAVPQSLGSFHSRKKLPEAWNGLRDDVLSETIGIDGCIFVHATGFIGGAKTKESVLAMAIKALDTV
jgi:uncharacterized UPF0160 family protein